MVHLLLGGHTAQGRLRKVVCHVRATLCKSGLRASVFQHSQGGPGDFPFPAPISADWQA